MTTPFNPSRWWRNRHLQTVWPVLITSKLKPYLYRQRIDTPDGDFVDLDWLGEPQKNKPLVVILHGLEGSGDSHYIRRLLVALTEAKTAAVIIHQRSCSGELNRRARTYHSGDTDDFNHVLSHITRQHPDCDYVAVGYSMGGNLLCKYLGETRQQSQIQRAVAISPPLNLALCARTIEQGFARVYQAHLINRLKAKIRNKLAMPELQSLPVTTTELNAISTFFEFDDAITAPLHGFNGVDDYYRRASGGQYLGEVSVPTLIVHALDDPFMTPDVIPSPKNVSENVALELSNYGGHVGFIEGGWPWAPKFYLEQRIISHLLPQK